MGAVLRKVPDYLVRDLLPFASAMALAEFFFKFGSFTPECLAFLSTWYVLARLYRAFLARAGIWRQQGSSLRQR